MNLLDFNEQLIDGKKLADIQYRDKIIKGCRVLNSKIEESNFSKTKFLETILKNVSVKKVNFDHCKFESDETEYVVEFEKCSLRGANVKYIAFKDSIFHECEMEKFKISYGVFRQCDIADNNMKEFVFDESDIWDKKLAFNDLRGAKLLGSGFNYLEVEENDFSKSFMDGHNWVSCKCNKDNFSDATISNVCFDNNLCNKCNFNCAFIKESYFDDSRFTECTFKNTKMEDTNFTNCKFEDIDLTSTVYKNVNFENCVFQNVMLTEEQKHEWRIDV